MIEAYQGVPLLGFIAPSGTGKTTLLTAVIPLLSQAGLRVGCIKLYPSLVRYRSAG